MSPEKTKAPAIGPAEAFKVTPNSHRTEIDMEVNTQTVSRQIRRSTAGRDALLQQLAMFAVSAGAYEDPTSPEVHFSAAERTELQTLLVRMAALVNSSAGTDGRALRAAREDVRLQGLMSRSIAASAGVH